MFRSGINFYRLFLLINWQNNPANNGFGMPQVFGKILASSVYASGAVCRWKGLVVRSEHSHKMEPTFSGASSFQYNNSAICCMEMRAFEFIRNIIFGK